MNVARLNFSHGDADEHHERLELLRTVTEGLGANVATMLDTRGIEIRTGELEDGHVLLDRGEPFELWTDLRLGGVGGVSVTYEGLANDLSTGDPVLIDDGSLELRVQKIDGGTIYCRVERGGVLQNRKGVNVPATALSMSAETSGDSEDLRFAAEHDVDYIAASFVQSAADVRAIRRVLAEHGAEIPIIAKIENRSGVKALEEIVGAANGTMVARGDLGVELDFVEVPAAQKKIIRKTVMNGKPVITATQMLDSMERNPSPTRAEVSDVANAIFDGTSAVMLSGETAIGEYPVEAVRTMAALAQQAESDLREYGFLQKILAEPANVVTEAVSQAAVAMADHVEAGAILCLTETGFTARAISKYRPESPILALTSQTVMRRLALNWGILALSYDGPSNDDAKIEFGIRRALELSLVRPGDVVVTTAGHNQQAGGTDMIRVVTVPRD